MTEKRAGDFRGRPDLDLGKGDSLGVISGLFREGMESRFRAKELGLNCQVETQLGFDGRVWYSDLRLEGNEFSLDTELVGVVGVPLVVPLGSVDGKGDLAVKVTMTVVRSDGSDLDDWVQSENEQDFLMKKRLREVAKDRDEEPRITTLENGVQRARFWVPKTFFDPFSDPFEEDPFRAGTEGADELLEFLKKWGIEIGESDRVVLIPGREGNVLFLQSTKENVEMVSNFVIGRTPPPGLLSYDLFLVESDHELERKALEKSWGRLICEASSSQMPGVVSKVFLGEGLRSEAALQLDAGGEMIDAKLSVGGQMGDFEAEVVTEIGVPMVVKQFPVEGKWRAWVIVTNAVGVGE